MQDMELTIEAYRKLCAEYTLRVSSPVKKACNRVNRNDSQAEEAEAKLTQAQNAITTMDANFANEVVAKIVC